MNEEAGFLSAIRQTPADDTAKLVYADWLNEQDNSECQTKAEFIRLELRLLETPAPSFDYRQRLDHLQKLATNIDPGWLVTVSKPEIEACRRFRDSSCPKHWSELTASAAAKVRLCNNCEKPVHYCETFTEAQNYMARGGCVVLTRALVRRLGDLYQMPTFLGRVAADELERRQLEARLATRAGAPNPDPEVIEVRWGGLSRPLVAPVPHRKRSREERAKRLDAKRRRQRRIERENWEELE